MSREDRLRQEGLDPADPEYLKKLSQALERDRQQLEALQEAERRARGKDQPRDQNA
jgi:uncharacterized membrane protein YdfJ with MMPL/SSD domain